MLGEYVTPLLVGGTKGVMAGNLVANFFDTGEYSRGAAAALLMSTLIVVALIVFRRSLDWRCQTMHEALDVVAPRARLIRRGLGVYGVAVYAFVFAPIAFLVLFSFNANPSGAFPITGLTTRWYQEMLGRLRAPGRLLDLARGGGAGDARSASLVGTAAAFPLVARAHALPQRRADRR